MKFFIATKITHHNLARMARQHLKAAGHEVTSRWIDAAGDKGGNWNPGDRNNKLAAYKDWSDLLTADALLLLVPRVGGQGMWVELGIALEAGKDIYVIGPGRERCIYCHTKMQHFPTMNELIDHLDSKEKANG